MFLKNKPELLANASTVRFETADRHNTAQRVGSLLADIVNSVDETFTIIEDYIKGLVKEAAGGIAGGVCDFNDAFEISTNDDGSKFIKAKFNFVGVGEITAYGDGSGSGGNGAVGGGASLLSQLGDVSLYTLTDGDALVWRNGKWVNEAASFGSGIDTAQLEAYLQGHSYVTQSALGSYVKKSGDTMTGTLYFGSTNVGIYNADNLLAFKGGDGADKLVIERNAVRRSSQTNIVDLGRSDLRWDTLYTNSINVTSNAVVTNLNADLLDGLHSGSFYHFDTTLWNNNETVADYAKRACNTVTALHTRGDWAWAESAQLTLGSYTIDRQRYSCLDFRRGNMNAVWQQKALLFLPTYADSKMIYIAQMSTEDTAGVVKTSVKRYADYDTIVGGNVNSATKLLNTRTIWGQSFNGEKDVRGTLTDVTDIRIAGLLYIKKTEHDSGFYLETNQNKEFSICEHSNYSWLRTAMVITAGTNNVGIGTPTPTAKLHVLGNILATGEVTAYSDERLKSDIKSIVAASRLRPVSFTKDGSRHIGLIAQEVQAVCPEVVHEGEWLSLNYSGALCFAVSGIYSEIDELKERLNKLERRSE